MGEKFALAINSNAIPIVNISFSATHSEKVIENNYFYIIRAELVTTCSSGQYYDMQKLVNIYLKREFFHLV